MSSQVEQKIQKLKKQIEHHNRFYYSLNSPEISDYEYDLLKRELEKLQKEHANEDLFEVNQVGFAPNEDLFSAKIKHSTPMLSLENAFNNDEVMEFDIRNRRFLKLNDNILYTAELKIDGLSFCAKYVNGKLDYIATRGDGEYGENVTKNAIQIDNFPKNIDEKITELEVRGEIYLSRESFEKLNNLQAAKGEKTFANPRNAASGSLRTLDSSITKNRNLSYFAYSMAQIKKFNEEINISSQSEALEMLQKLGFVTNDMVCKRQNLQACLDFYAKIEKSRYEIQYDIDGIVYKIDDTSLQNRLGSTNKSPRWAIAHKFPGNYAISKIENIVHQVGRLGNITPVAEIDPINIGGAIIKRSTLHNYEEISRLGIGIGDIVKVTRAGDVVPRVVELVEKKSDTQIKIPTHCPACSSSLQKDNDLVAIRCINPQCQEQILQKIIHFASKDAFDIMGLGDKQVERFYKLGLIKTLADIFHLDQHLMQISSLEGMGRKSTLNLMQAIQKSKTQTLARFIYALSIKHVGVVVSETLAKSFKTIENLLELAKNPEEMCQYVSEINGLGSKIAHEIKAFLQIDTNRQLLFELSSIVKIIPYVNRELRYSGKKIIFTGTLVNMTRQEAKNLAQNLGFEIASNISKNLDFVVAGENPGSKLKLAKELQLKIVTEDQWREMTAKD